MAAALEGPLEATMIGKIAKLMKAYVVVVIAFIVGFGALTFSMPEAPSSSELQTLRIKRRGPDDGRLMFAEVQSVPKPASPASIVFQVLNPPKPTESTPFEMPEADSAVTTVSEIEAHQATHED